MPDASAFLKGFGFIKGCTFDGYILINATSTHETIRQYQEYKYSITLTFKNAGGDYQTLFDSVMSVITQEHIIYGIRNPYRCIIDTPNYGDITEDDDNTIVFHLTGHSYRSKLNK